VDTVERRLENNILDDLILLEGSGFPFKDEEYFSWVLTFKVRLKKMNEEPTQRKPVRPSPVRINTVIEYFTTESDEFDADNSSEDTPMPSTIGVACARLPEQPSSPLKGFPQSKKSLAIEIKVTTTEDGNRDVIEASSSSPENGFFTGPVSLLTKEDLMSMIQEGIRIGISETAKNNRMKVMRKTHTRIQSRVSQSSNAPGSPSGTGKTMKYMLHQYKPKNFQILRRLSGIDTDDFVRSICDNELLGGFTEASGKSGSIFWYSSDRKYIMKSISEHESSLLQKISSSYTRFMATHPHTLLCRFVGMYKIVTTVATPSYISGNKRPSRVRPNTVLTTRFVIMKNIFSQTPSTGMDKFDLKGTTEDRYVKRVTGNEVLKDINFQSRWISLPENLAECLTRVIEEDSEYLFRHGIMDYSMIVGVAPATDRSCVEALEAEADGIAVSTVLNQGRPKNLKEKIHARLAKAAESVQKLFKPTTRTSSANPDDASASENENVPEDEPPTAMTVGRDSDSSLQVQSVFTLFRDGVVGVDEDVRKPVIYYVGIIDILQQYTVKKKAANLVKRCTIGCCHEIDTVAPGYYRARFVRYLTGKVQSIDAERIDSLCRTHLN
jgi:1-phosphatidylinositol-4-phosphate 5-kinase